MAVALEPRENQLLSAATLREAQTTDDTIRWSPRKTLLVSGGAALVLWGLIAAAVSSVITALR